MKQIEEILHKAGELRSHGFLQEARSFLEEQLQTYPDKAELHALLGQICQQSGNYPSAICHLKKALALNPNLLDALFTLGVAEQISGNHLHAIEIMDEIIKAVPSLPHAYCYRGLALQGVGRDPEAKVAFEQALVLNPDYAEVMGNLAAILFKNYHFDAAESLLIRALELSPELNYLRNDLARLYQLEGKTEESLVLFSQVVQREPEHRMALSNLLYSYCYLDSMSPEEIARQHTSRCNVFFPVKQTTQQYDNRPDLCNNNRINIGYISNDFCFHSVSFFIEPILIHHNRNKFRIFCYSNRSVTDETTGRIRSLDIVWRDISNLSCEDAAVAIRNDGINILVDLSGHTGKNRLDVCALKPAPVMATWIGYPHSTGMCQFDYYISDHICDPNGMTDHLYCEKIWRLPRVFSCYLPPLEFPTVSSAPYKKNNHITFGSFNNLAKVNDVTIKLWSDVLRQIPDARMFIKSASLGGVAARKLITEKFASYGITENRLILKVHAPTPFQHLEMYSDIDIALDTYPYHGTTTTCEALWMGVPVITLAGRFHHARVGASFLINVGCRELVANSQNEFVKIAIGLASDIQRIDRYRDSLRCSMATSPLMDGVGVTRDVEEAYMVMLDSYMCKTKEDE